VIRGGVARGSPSSSADEGRLRALFVGTAVAVSVPVPDMSSLDLERIHLVKPYGPTTAVDRIDLRIDARAALAWLR